MGSLYSNYKPSSLEIAIEAWQNIFADVPYDVVAGALYSYAKGNNEFPPTVGQLNTIIENAKNQNEMTEAEAWNMVVKALRNGYYGANEEFAKLPEDVQRAIGSPSYLVSLSMCDNVNLSVESSNFYRQYRAIVERKKSLNNLPMKARAYCDAISASNAMQIVDKQNEYSNRKRDEASAAMARAFPEEEKPFNPDDTVPGTAWVNELKRRSAELEYQEHGSKEEGDKECLEKGKSVAERANGMSSRNLTSHGFA